MNKKLLSLYSLKFNPFSAEVPASALCNTASIQSFCWRIEQQIGEGGFALAIGDPGTGKSAALRILVERLGNLADVMGGSFNSSTGGHSRSVSRTWPPVLGPPGASQPMGQRQSFTRKMAASP